ncbi:MAG: ComF family protein [Clostridia bacterium]|nr:ComF family protein [Clostridia bacterium]
MSFLSHLTELLFPTPQICPLCNTKQDKLMICASCLEKLEKIKKDLSQCSRCGTFGRIGSFCDNCRDWPPYMAKNFAAVPYIDEYKELLHKFKFNKQGWLAPVLVELLLKEIPPAKFDLVLPVPLHIVRFRERGFNQSALLAQPLACGLNVTYSDTILQRKLNTPHQTGLNRKDRRLNLEGAFQVARINLVKDKNILIVDDVLTTGATLLECAKALRNAGAGTIYCTTWAAGVV